MKGLLAECEDELPQLPVHQGDLPSASVNILRDREAFCQLPTNFCTARNLSLTSIKFPPNFLRHFCQLSLIFLVAGRPIVNFCHLTVQTGDLPSTSIKFCAAGHLPSTFFASRKPLINSRHLAVWPGDFPSSFHAPSHPSINFRLHFVSPGDFP